VTRVLVASDWHLSARSSLAHRRLAAAFLRRARDAGDEVVLNGDILEGLFTPLAEAERALPEVVDAIDALAREGRLRRTAGNHDPAAGAASLELIVPGVGRVLVAHGHEADPLHRSALGRLGDGISRSFGRLALVRGAAELAERSSRALAGASMAATFRRRCLALVERGGFDLGVFGHLHVPHLAPGDPYANAGALRGESLEHLVLGDGPPRLARLMLGEVA
jgi:predicted phosphodiesterase